MRRGRPEVLCRCDNRSRRGAAGGTLLSVAIAGFAALAGPVSAAYAAERSGSTMAQTQGASDLARQIDGELDRLADVLARLPRSPQMEASFAECRDGLARARAARALELRLYRLRAPFVAIETLAYVAVHSAMGADVEHLAALWHQVGERPPATAPPRPGPLLLVALADAAHNKAEKLYRAALPYGKVAGPGAGLYYLAQGEAQRSFGDFSSRLAAGAPAHDPPPAHEALAAALEQLRAEAVADFDRLPGGFDLVPVSSGLKEAGELLEAGSAEAAALALLDARFALSIVEAGTDPVRGRRRLPPPALATPCPDSLCALYVAAAREAKDETVPRAINGSVLPLYEAILRRTP